MKLPLKNESGYKTKCEVKEDVTSYGNRFYIQLIDTEENDNSFFRELIGKEFELDLIKIRMGDKYTVPMQMSNMFSKIKEVVGDDEC